EVRVCGPQRRLLRCASAHDRRVRGRRFNTALDHPAHDRPDHRRVCPASRGIRPRLGRGPLRDLGTWTCEVGATAVPPVGDPAALVERGCEAHAPTVTRIEYVRKEYLARIEYV